MVLLQPLEFRGRHTTSVFCLLSTFPPATNGDIYGKTLNRFRTICGLVAQCMDSEGLLMAIATVTSTVAKPCDTALGELVESLLDLRARNL